jgi:nucleotide-binding universal stress UspA family protein
MTITAEECEKDLKTKRKKGERTESATGPGGGKPMRVLLATDGSKFSEAALQAIIGHYEPKETEVRVLNVVDLHLPIPTLYAEEFREESLKEGQGLVQEAKTRLAKAGYRVQTEVEEGDPKAKIVEDAARWQADMIVMGSHGRRGMDRFLMGSVSDAVARHAPCSVEIVRLSTNGSGKEKNKAAQ